MTLVHCENYEAFFAQLNAEIQERLDSEPARRMTVFSRLFFESFPLEELEAANLRDIYASTYFFWNQFQKLDRSKPRVQVFNPTLEEHGWTSDYTIVAVFACDMPFLMDSLRLALDRRNIPINMLHSSVFEVERNTQFELVDFWGPDPSTDINRERIALREALIYLEIHRHSSISDFEAIAQDLDSVIADVSLAVEDFDTMRSRARKLLEDLEKSPPDCIPPADIEESRAFIAWMLDDHFTFLGVTEVVSTMESGGRAIREDTERRLGRRDPAGVDVKDRFDRLSRHHFLSDGAAGVPVLRIGHRSIHLFRTIIRSALPHRCHGDLHRDHSPKGAQRLDPGTVWVNLPRMPPVCLLLLIALIGVPVLIGLSEPGDEVPGRGTVALTAGPTVLWLVSALAVCLAFIENLLK